MPTRRAVYFAIDEERIYQSQLPPDRYDGHEMAVGEYLCLMRTYLSEAEKLNNQHADPTPVLHVMRKITALGVKCMESLGAPQRC